MKQPSCVLQGNWKKLNPGKIFLLKFSQTNNLPRHFDSEQIGPIGKIMNVDLKINERPQLKKTIGRLGFFSLAFGSMIGVGWITG